MDFMGQSTMPRKDKGQASFSVDYCSERDLRPRNECTEERDHISMRSTSDY